MKRSVNSLGTLLVAALFLFQPPVCEQVLAQAQRQPSKAPRRTDAAPQTTPRQRPQAVPQRTVPQTQDRAPRTATPGAVPTRSAPARTPTSFGLDPQEKQQSFMPRDAARGQQPEFRSIFSTIEQGLSSGDVSAFSRHMGSQVYVRLRGKEGGYYSASQAYYLLDQFLRTQKVSGFRFSTVGSSETNPYATGSAGLVVRGAREFAQVYVSLSQAGDRWVISQINIY